MKGLTVELNLPSPMTSGPVLLVGNYLPDGQESMLRFARMLLDGLRAAGRPAELIAPGAYFGRWLPSDTGLGKWLAYVDKYLIFPWILRRRVRALRGSGAVIICDHSNAMDAPAAGSAGHPVVVVCHDLGAVRGALGEATDCPASRMGRILQAWITRSLGRADAIACVSTATLRDVERLVRRPDGTLPRTTLVLNGFNVPYRQLTPAEAQARLAQASIPGLDADTPFVLNVGSSLRRKNRDGVLRIFARVKDRWPSGKIVFAGEALTDEARALAASLGVADRVVEAVKPGDAVLEALYNRALALLFPSRFEGFGWPAIEAQACGCPVLCSDAGSLGEVVADSAFVRPASDEAAFAGELTRLIEDHGARGHWIEAGLRNVERFATNVMIEKYTRLLDELTGVRPPTQAYPAVLAAR